MKTKPRKPKDAAARLAPLVLAVFGAGNAAALEWPAENPEIISLFGQRAAYSVERGMILENAETVRTAGDGELLLVISENENMSGFPSALGNAVLLAHEDGIVSVYGNLESADRIADRVQIEQNTVLAQTGRSAWSEAEGACIFQLADQRQENLLNPLLLLPPKEDNRRPVIRNVTLESAGGQVYHMASSRYIRNGTYKVYAAVTDTYPRNPAELAPFRVSVSVNGMETVTLPFETLRENGGTLVPDVTPDYLADGIPLYNDAGQIYAGDISLTRGRTELTVTTRDFAGNEQTATFMLQIE